MSENRKGMMTYKQVSNLFFFASGLATAGWLAGIASKWGPLIGIVIAIWFRRHVYAYLLWRFYYKWFKGIE